MLFVYNINVLEKHYQLYMISNLAQVLFFNIFSSFYFHCCSQLHIAVSINVTYYGDSTFYIPCFFGPIISSWDYGYVENITSVSGKFIDNSNYYNNKFFKLKITIINFQQL